MGNFRFFRIQKDNLYAVSRYWSPRYYFAVTPGIYLETDITKATAFFTDLMVGYGNENGSSNVEITVDAGFVFKLTSFLKASVSGFYSQTGRNLVTKNYSLYGGRGYLTFGF